MINYLKSFYETLSMNFQTLGTIGALIDSIAGVAGANADISGMTES